MNKYEDPTVRLTSHTWSEKYKENYGEVFGFKYKLFYSNGDQKTVKFKTQKEADWFIYNEGDHLTDYIKL